MNHFNITELSNRIKIVTENIPYVKSFSLGFWFNVGSRDENAVNNGLSHFIEHMLFKGTKKRSAKKIANDIESLGGYLNAFTSKEHTCYYGRGLVQHIEKTFEVLSDMVQNSVFKESDILKESSVIIDELNDIEDSPEESIFDKFETDTFTGNALSLPIIGNERNLKKFTRNDVLNFIKQNYCFNNLYIIASGAVNHQEIIDFTKKYITKDLGYTKKSRHTPKSFETKELYINKDIQQTHFILGKSTIGFNNPRRTAISVFSHVLGEGSSSRLFQSVREKNGIAYLINSFLNSFFDVSTFGIYFSTTEKSVDRALTLIYNEFEKLKTKKISERELKKAKEYLKGNIILSLENTTNRMMRMGHSIIYFKRLKSVEETIREIDAVTTEEVLNIANELLYEKSLSRVLIGSKNLFLKSA
ncbi:MAG: peptidase [Ignavibacteria bacterium RBG_13_36_8]|nr:MAG: peptidase [Ignavibacteria bacterium RBG_13_36_8]